MSNISDRIERMIDELLDQHDGIVEISRNKLAQEIRVVPSQISYVLTTRFSNSHGYVVESRRGGGCSITIKRISTSTAAQALWHLIKEMPDYLSQQEAYQIIANLRRSGLLEEEIAEIFRAAMADQVFADIDRRLADQLRCRILRNMLAALATLI